MLFSGFDLIDWGVARVTDYIGFLRSIPSFFAPKPSPAAPFYIPPFEGGQGVGVNYDVLVELITANGSVYQQWENGLRGAIAGLIVESSNSRILEYRVLGDRRPGSQISRANYFSGFDMNLGSINIKQIRRSDGQPDTNGNIPNPTPSPSINDDGLFTPNNPVIGDENGTLNPAAIILSPAAPIIAIGGGLALAAAAAAKAATDALEAIKKVAEALDSLKKLWEKLQEFLEEWDKDRPKNRDIVRQTYGTIDGDGAIDFYPLNNKNFVAIQVDIVITEVPVGFGKYFGNTSPSRYRYKELGYISFYSISKGIIETHSIQFKRTSLIIPKTAVGFIYHFGLDNKIKGFAFGTFSVRKT